LFSPGNGDVGVLLSPALIWLSIGGVTSYRVQLATDSSFTTPILDQPGVTESALSLSGLSLSTEYFWRVLAVNSYGEGPWSSAWSFTTTSEEEAEDIMSIMMPMFMMVMMMGVVRGGMENSGGIGGLA